MREQGENSTNFLEENSSGNFQSYQQWINKTEVEKLLEENSDREVREFCTELWSRIWKELLTEYPQHPFDVLMDLRHERKENGNCLSEKEKAAGKLLVEEGKQVWERLRK